MAKIIINFLIGCAFIGIGFYGFILKTDGIQSFFGRIPFFDKYLGTEGGTKLGYKIIGCLIIFIGFLVAFGLIDKFMLWMFSPITKYNWK